MKKKLMIMTLSLAFAMSATACGSAKAPAETKAPEGTQAPSTADETQTTNAETQAESETPAETKAPESTPAPEDVVYQNIAFDHSEEISAYGAKSTDFTTPAAPEAPITVSDANGATGVQLVASADTANTTDLYMNALIAGNELTFAGDIASATSQAGDGKATDLEVADGSVKFTPADISAADPVDEVVTLTLTDGTVYKIHTVNELMADMDIVSNGKADAGVYTFAIDKFLLRVNTDGSIVYYRNVGCIGESLMAENFMAQDTEDGRFYTYFVELKPQWRNANGGFSSGMYVVMDSNYKEINYVTLQANDDPNHTHGEGYLDQHEFVLLGENHWISLSYTPLMVENIPDGLGIDGKNTGYVHAGIIQEVMDGKVIHEINTTDYEEFYKTAMECADYETSTDQATADDVKDYVHVNSVCLDPKDGNYLVSMRHQYAVYKFNRETGEIMWTLGGKENDFTGLDEVLDENGNLFIGQHYARYVDSALAGNDSTITVFDNHTSFQGNTTRTMEFVLDETAMTATATVIQGSDLDAMTQKAHWATHCGSIEHQSETSVIIGWGLNVVLDLNPETINNHPVFTDFNPTDHTVAFELCVSRNPLMQTHEACFSYRTYKNAD